VPWARRFPGIAQMADVVARIAAWRARGRPMGLIVLLPLAMIIDAIDTADELFFGPVGVAVAFVLETTFLLGVTGQAGRALGMASIDLIPFIDTLPFATITTVREIVRQWRGPRVVAGPDGPVIDA